jgi:hypothetical protein
MQDCPASSQSGAGMKKTNGAGTSPVPDKADAVQHFFYSGTGVKSWMPEY